MATGLNKKMPNNGASLGEFLDALPFYVMLIDETHHILMANEAVREDLGMDPEEIVGEFCPRVVHGLEHPFIGLSSRRGC